jgi:hypothetical protein
LAFRSFGWQCAKGARSIISAQRPGMLNSCDTQRLDRKLPLHHDQEMALHRDRLSERK